MLLYHDIRALKNHNPNPKKPNPNPNLTINPPPPSPLNHLASIPPVRPRPPQQNGVAERKNKHLDIAKTRLFYRRVPREFWGEIILTIYFLINRMSSSVLQNKIPYFILYPDIDLFSLPQKNFFWSLCFIHNHSSHKTKIDSRFS